MFFRTLGHSIFSLIGWPKFSIASSSLAGIRILPLFIVPDHTSLWNKNSTLSNRYILYSGLVFDIILTLVNFLRWMNLTNLDEEN